LKKGKAKEVKPLVYGGYKINISLGAGDFIRLPGCQTLDPSIIASAPAVSSFSPSAVSSGIAVHFMTAVMTLYQKGVLCE